jgi:oligopeptide transport system substrate-binding protein
VLGAGAVPVLHHSAEPGGHNLPVKPVAVLQPPAPLGLFSSDATTHFAFLREKPPFDVARSGWFADFPDAQNFLFLAQRDNQALKVASFSNEIYDGLMREAQRESLPERRRVILHKTEALLLREWPDLVILTYESRNLVSSRLKGWEPNVRDTHSGRFVSIAP